MSETWHRLTEVDPDARTAICSRCGPTSVHIEHRRKGGKPHARCMTKHRAGKRAGHGPRHDAARQAAVEAQGGLCAACGEGGRQLQDDHDHTTGEPRDMLCRRCNTTLGMAHDDPAILQALVAYLRKWGK